MSLNKQMRWLRRAGGGRARRMAAVWAMAAGCVWMLGWAGTSAAVAAARNSSASARDSSAAARSSARQAASRSVALSPWEQAERGLETLQAIPEATRTRADYNRAMNGYRAIYHANPADVHAPAAVYAVARLLAQQGRGLHDEKSLRDAVGQYEFLRKQYPASSLGAPALLAEGQIEQNDLNDAAVARRKYKLLLKNHPRSVQAEEARAGLASLGADQSALVITEHRDQANRTDQVAQQSRSSLPPMPRTSRTVTRVRVAAARPAAASSVGLVHAVGGAPDLSAAGGLAHSGKLALVTGIRHWSTATYTRVVIDLGDNVQYEAARVPDPDRIYFDLYGTRLAPGLVGKSFAVTDDGFLKRIRAAQFSNDITRVVLDVDDVTEYSAFLLPNPYRLIIDVHGAVGAAGAAARETSGIQGAANGSAASAVAVAPVASFAVLSPRAASTARAAATRTAATSGGATVAVATSSAANASAVRDVDDLSQLPGRVEATTRPTSKPISEVVSGQETATARTGCERAVRARAGSEKTRPERAEHAARPVPSGARTGGTQADAVAASARSARAGRSSRTEVADASMSAGTADVEEAMPAREAVPTADGETSMVRALGLKIRRIVIDPGHGGHDSGTLGVGGIEEKNVVLDVALRLGKLLHDRLGAQIIYTRTDDTFIPLETRTAIANKAQADLFISIHANSSSDPDVRGVETYYLNFTTDPAALEVAARENAVSDQSIHQLSNLVKKIALTDKIEESREFASDVQTSLYDGLRTGNPGLRNRGVKKAPFVVLIGANMPSILAEISFVTNPRDAHLLREPQYRERVAESLYRGVARYEAGLSAAGPATERAAVGQ